MNEGRRERYRTAGVAACIALLLVLLVVALQRPSPSRADAWPDPAEMDSLSRYLEPVTGPGWDDDPLGDPAWMDRRPQAQPRVDQPSAPVVDPVQREVSAILISRDRRTAIIDDMRVVVGDRLPDGARVSAIERDHVVVTDPRGTRRVLWLQDGGAR